MFTIAWDLADVSKAKYILPVNWDTLNAFAQSVAALEPC